MRQTDSCLWPPIRRSHEDPLLAHSPELKRHAAHKAACGQAIHGILGCNSKGTKHMSMLRILETSCRLCKFLIHKAPYSQVQARPPDAASVWTQHAPQINHCLSGRTLRLICKQLNLIGTCGMKHVRQQGTTVGTERRCETYHIHIPMQCRLHVFQRKNWMAHKAHSHWVVVAHDSYR